MTTLTITQNGITVTFNHTAPVLDAMKVLDRVKYGRIKIDAPRHVDKVREFMVHRR